jgi:hypothetical protein
MCCNLVVKVVILLAHIHTQVAELSKQVDKTLKAQQQAASLKEELKVRPHMPQSLHISTKINQHLCRVQTYTILSLLPSLHFHQLLLQTYHLQLESAYLSDFIFESPTG